jgi:hypothetical protein
MPADGDRAGMTLLIEKRAGSHVIVTLNTGPLPDTGPVDQQERAAFG